MPHYTYIELLEGANSKTLISKINGIIHKNVKGSKADVFLQNIKKIHLYSLRKVYRQTSVGIGDIAYIRILGLLLFSFFSLPVSTS